MCGTNFQRSIQSNDWIPIEVHWVFQFRFNVRQLWVAKRLVSIVQFYGLCNCCFIVCIQWVIVKKNGSGIIRRQSFRRVESRTSVYCFTTGTKSSPPQKTSSTTTTVNASDVADPTIVDRWCSEESVNTVTLSAYCGRADLNRQMRPLRCTFLTNLRYRVEPKKNFVSFYSQPNAINGGESVGNEKNIRRIISSP